MNEFTAARAQQHRADLMAAAAHARTCGELSARRRHATAPRRLRWLPLRRRPLLRVADAR